MNIPTLIGSAVIAIIMIAIFTHGFKPSKKKSGGCGGSCGCCPYSKSCHH